MLTNFEWVYIHIGNYEDQTSGCILVGESANSCGTISQSTSAYYRVYMACLNAFENGDKVYILISDEPHMNDLVLGQASQITGKTAQEYIAATISEKQQARVCVT